MTPKELKVYQALWKKMDKRIEKYDGDNDAEFELGTFAQGYLQALNDFGKALNK